jgi:hypoxanthine phosphoribosyltransferase
MTGEIDYASVITVPENGIAGSTQPIGADARIRTVLIPEECLRARVRALAGQICQDYATSRELHVVVVLNGAFVFAADLGREICRQGGPDIRYDFLKAITYGSGLKGARETERQVSITLKPAHLEGSDILLVDDIVDQAFTLSKARHLLEIDGTASIRTCALLYKLLRHPSSRVKDLKNKLAIDYVGFNVPDKWVAGYGIDAGEDFRHLPFVVAVNESHYRNDIH